MSNSDIKSDDIGPPVAPNSGRIKSGDGSGQRLINLDLKKQGVLPLTFADESSWDLLRVDDRLTIKGTDELGPNSKVTVEAKHSDGTMDTFVCNHSMDELQVEWFKAGSALNYLRSQN